jgi:predicted transposase YdaD
MSNPHDALFKRTFQDLETAAGELRSVLPAKLVERIDWGSLRLEPGSFVDGRFRERHTDLLYSVRLEGREAAKAPDGKAALESVLRYIMVVRQDPTDWLREFVVEAVGQEAEEVYMSTAERLRQEGLEQGLRKGRAEGRAELVLKQLTLRFGTLPEETVRQVRGASIDELDRWAERVLDAGSIDEVFGAE